MCAALVHQRMGTWVKWPERFCSPQQFCWNDWKCVRRAECWGSCIAVSGLFQTIDRVSGAIFHLFLDLTVLFLFTLWHVCVSVLYCFCLVQVVCMLWVERSVQISSKCSKPKLRVSPFDDVEDLIWRSSARLYSSLLLKLFYHKREHLRNICPSALIMMFADDTVIRWRHALESRGMKVSHSKRGTQVERWG